MTTLKQQMHAWILERSRTSPSSWRDVDCEDAFLAGAEAERRRIVDIIEVARCYVGGPVDEITLGYEYLIKEIAKDGGEGE